MGMRMQNIQMKAVVKKTELLDTLETNLKRHSKIVQEAREGYAEKAREALLQKLEKIKSGKCEALTFSLRPPLDYSEVYKSVIAMLKWTTQEEIELQADEFRQLVEDKWDWSRDFYAGNAEYSSTAAYFGGIQAQFD